MVELPTVEIIKKKDGQEIVVEVVAPEALRLLIFGLAMVLIMLRRPEGLWPAPRHGKA